VPDFYPASIME